jgi:hypothetical protein
VHLAAKLGHWGVISAVRPSHLFFVRDSSSNFLVNTGYAFSIMPRQSPDSPSGPSLSGADGRLIPCWGEWSFTITIGSVPGYGSTDLRLYTSTKQKMVNYWFYSLMHKKTKFVFK